MRVGMVGAGAASLAAAWEMVRNGGGDVEIVIFEKGRDVENRGCALLKELTYNCAHCSPCNIMSGVGGAGVWSSGILNLSPEIGGDLAELAGSRAAAKRLIELVDEMFVSCGAPQTVFDPEDEREAIHELKRRAAAADIKFIPVKQRLMGTENAPRVISNLRDYLLASNKVQLFTNAEVLDVTPELEVITANKPPQRFDAVLLAPGRVGMDWLSSLCQRLGVPYQHGPLDIGLRVEVPAIIMEPVCSIQRDPKFHVISSRYDDFLRTFCVNHRGFVVRETYPDGIVGVNGHSFWDRASGNTNFALLDRVVLTEPLEDSAAYGHAIAKQTTILGGQNPLVQTLGDLRRGRRSTPSRLKKNLVKSTLNDETPGDLAMAYPHRIIYNLIDVLERLDRVVPGIANDSTLLHAPEVKYSANVVVTDENLQTPLAGLFVAGDGAGLSRGIVGAAVTGIIAARGILDS
ncbi:MAG: NAD(P)/FAD-dependent oxidoreductase [Promethearchaeota archaeon]